MSIEVLGGPYKTDDKGRPVHNWLDRNKLRAHCEAAMRTVSNSHDNYAVLAAQTLKVLDDEKALREYVEALELMIITTCERIENERAKTGV